MKLFVYVLLFVLSFSFVSATYFDIQVHNDGTVDLEGYGFVMKGTDDFTSKQGSVWTLNVSLEKEFSVVDYKIGLPKNSVINYMRLPSLSHIGSSENGLIIQGNASNKKANFILQYSIEKNYVKNKSFLVSIIFAIIFVIGVLLLFVSSTKSKKSKVDIRTLSFRQKKIVLLLENNDGHMTQAQLEKETGFPKSSLSRNIETLVKRDIVSKESRGMSNSIILK